MTSHRSNDTTDVFRSVELPDGSDPVSKGIVTNVTTRSGTTTVEVAIDGLGESLAERIVQQIRGAALAQPGTDHVRVIPTQQAENDVELPTVDHVVAVASAKGGVGKTTIAVALARTLSVRGYDVGLFDADIYGPNVPHLLEDVEGPVLTNEHGQPVPLEGTDGLEVLSPGAVAGDPPTARRGAIAYGAVENLLGQGAWTDRDVLIIDMPAGSDDVVGAVLEHVPVDGAVYVTTPFDASVDDTRRTRELFEERGVTSIAAVVNMNSVVCECCGEPNRLFEADIDLDVPAIHELPFDRELQRNPGGHERRTTDAVDEFVTTVAEFVEAVHGTVPDDALDLRGLPKNSQVRQLSDELATATPGSRVRAVVEDPPAVRERLESDAGELFDELERSQIGTTGALLEIEIEAEAETEVDRARS
ncbi:P-loop NTPase [Halobiforma nitratireducens]|uniref:Chromosome partitioning ATPase n=1 Tax=Halobiforma nitratireducens JCM 10879 TaxID=1227454 RepID=M0MKR8_9EURY|nr:P-loop NTPase [Halobiforma nitratireducens]EMA45968.1 chromosome partitioning ATPase [Halobiforma nitratireducens JCM 10879]